MRQVEVPQELYEELHEFVDEDEVSEKQTINQAYRNASAKFHPDVGGDVETFKAIKDAADDIQDMLEYRSPVRLAPEEQTGSTSNHKSEGQNTTFPWEDLLESGVRNGLDDYSSVLGETYNIMDMEGETVTIEKATGDLMIGMEFDGQGTEMDVEATYFTDKDGVIETATSHRNYGAIMRGTEREDPEIEDVFESAAYKLAGEAVLKSEQDIDSEHL